VMGLADHVIVMHHGEKIADGAPDEIRRQLLGTQLAAVGLHRSAQRGYPVLHVDLQGLTREPALVLQGLDDKVVLPAQAEQIVAALAENGIPYAYLAFEGEGHGFRGETAQRRTLEAQLSFLGQVFGFEPADAIEPVELVGGKVPAAR